MAPPPSSPSPQTATSSGIEVDLEVIWPGEAAYYLHFSLSHQSLPEIGECTILVGHDETLRHQAQHAIAQTAKLVTLGEMTTGMAHELSQPLNVIKMAAQNALSEVDAVRTAGSRRRAFAGANGRCRAPPVHRRQA